MEAPEFFQAAAAAAAAGICPQFKPEMTPSSAGDHFVIEDLLDFSNEDADVVAEAAFDGLPGNSSDSSAITVVDSCNSSSFSGGDPNSTADIPAQHLVEAQFSSDLCVPQDDLAELEWLSNIGEESFSSEELQKLQLISGMRARTYQPSNTTLMPHEYPTEPNRSVPIFDPNMAVPAKARSKRSRSAPCNWTSHLLVSSPASSSSENDVVPAPPPPPPPPQPTPGKKTSKGTSKKKESLDGGGANGEGRKCLHCATDKTPQWRTGPMGPKTLCNACGVRYKSGRLVPEYRPAASPTFVLTKHSNSHRKVMELRRQKEMARAAQHQQQLQQHQLDHHQQNVIFNVTNAEDYLIHQHLGPNFSRMIQ